MAILYPNHFLKQVIFQVNFNSIIALRNYLDSVIKELCFEITGSQIKENKSQTINIGFPGQPVNTETASQWVSKGNDLQIIIQHTTLQIVNSKYSDHKHFQGVIDKLFSKIQELYKPIITRIALRYINQINFPEGSAYDFNGLINPNLLQPTIALKDEGLTRSIGSSIMLDDVKGLSTTFTYGFYNSQFPNKIAKREFLLDYDCSTTISSLNPYNESLLPILTKIKDKVNDLFDKSIEQGLKDKMQSNGRN